nr:hypothetical protein [Sphingobium yanoikuyae]
MIAFHDSADDIGRQQPFLKAVQHPFLQPVCRYPARIVAGALFPVASAAPAILGNNRIAVAASAFDEARENMARTRLPLKGDGCQILLSCLGLRPCGVIDDPQLRRFALHQVRLLIDAGEPFAAMGVSHHADAAIADHACIDGVAEDAIVAGRRSIDGAGPPLAPARRGNLLGIEPMGYRPGRFACHIFGKDPANHFGFALIDLAVAIFDAAVRIDQRRDVVAIASTARHTAACDAAGGATPDLVAHVL